MIKMKSILKKFEEAERYVDMQREYNTSTYINGYVLEEKDGKVCVLIEYEIFYDEDRPCDFGFTWFELEYYPTKEELEFLKKNGYNL